MAQPEDATFYVRVKLTLLLLIYPGLCWLFVNGFNDNSSPERPNVPEPLIGPVNISLFLVVAIGFLLLAGVPLWSARTRRRPLELTQSFRLGLRIVAAFIAIVLPVQGALFALALYVADPEEELWLWGLVIFGAAVFATIVLLRSGLHEQPGVYVTLRAERLQLNQHPKLAALLGEVAESNRVPLPAAILVGLQPDLIWTTRTVFCPDGELQGGVLCFSLPTSFILSIAEFRALTGEALLGLQADLKEGRTQFLSTTEAANGVLADLDETMREWSWSPRLGFHPALVVLWLGIVAAMRFPLYLGKELLTYYLREFWISREIADAFRSIEAHGSSTADVGTVPVISAHIKEAAMGLRSLTLGAGGEALHALGEVVTRVIQQHPELKFEHRASGHHDPVSAWQYLQFRCSLSGLNLDWCKQMALEVNPEPSAATLFADPGTLEARLVEILESPFVSVRR